MHNVNSQHLSFFSLCWLGLGQCVGDTKIKNVFCLRQQHTSVLRKQMFEGQQDTWY